MLDESRSEDRDKLKDYFLSKDVAIDIVSASENPDAQEISAALTAVFLKPGEPVTDIVPEYWRDYFDQIEGQPHSVPHSRETVYKVKAGEVFPPKVISQPEPEILWICSRSEIPRLWDPVAVGRCFRPDDGYSDHFTAGFRARREGS